MERDILPELFTESGVTSIQLEDGSRITLSTMSEGSLPKDPAARAAALEWLSANGFENLIECRLAASWTRGDRAKAQVEYERLAALGTAKVALDETIHPMTLGARIRDRIVAGQPTPLDLIGVSVFQRARFTKKAGTSNDQ
jgi:glutathione S-transferase